MSTFKANLKLKCLIFFSFSVFVPSQPPWVSCRAVSSSSSSSSASPSSPRPSGCLVRGNPTNPASLRRPPNRPNDPETAQCPALESWPPRRAIAAPGRRLVKAWWACWWTAALKHWTTSRGEGNRHLSADSPLRRWWRAMWTYTYLLSLKNWPKCSCWSLSIIEIIQGFTWWGGHWKLKLYLKSFPVLSRLKILNIHHESFPLGSWWSHEVCDV